MQKVSFGKDAAFSLYCSAISETRYRTEVVRSLIGDSPPNVEARYLQELSYLQLRKVCELIAFGCLVAHGDIRGTQTSKSKKKWNADKIVLALRKLHRNFYPQPFTIGRIVGKTAIEEKMEEPFLTKAELLSLYRVECPRYLHSGTVDDLVARRRPPIDRNKIAGYLGKISNLLTRHRIYLHGISQALRVDASLPDFAVNAQSFESYALRR
jgi:hypothetical protein